MNVNSNSAFKNIVVCGDVGTGTTTLSEGLAEKLSWRHVSAGDFFREYQKKHNIPLWDKMAIPDEVERKFDNELFDKIRKDKNIVFDSHYGGWFARKLEYVFRVLLTSGRQTAAKRIIEREHTHKEDPDEIEERRKQLREKFKKLYSDDNYEDPKYFHLVTDTTKTDARETLRIALERFQRKVS